MDEGGAEAEGGWSRGGVDSHATEPEKSSSCSESSLGALFGCRSWGQRGRVMRSRARASRSLSTRPPTRV